MGLCDLVICQQVCLPAKLQSWCSKHQPAYEGGGCGVGNGHSPSGCPVASRAPPVLCTSPSQSPSHSHVVTLPPHQGLPLCELQSLPVLHVGEEHPLCVDLLQSLNKVMSVPTPWALRWALCYQQTVAIILMTAFTFAVKLFIWDNCRFACSWRK